MPETGVPKNLHRSLDLLGLAPGGAPFDMLNAALYAKERKWGPSLWSLAAAVPFAGTAVGLAKISREAIEIGPFYRKLLREAESKGFFKGEVPEAFSADTYLTTFRTKKGLANWQKRLEREFGGGKKLKTFEKYKPVRTAGGAQEGMIGTQRVPEAAQRTVVKAVRDPRSRKVSTDVGFSRKTPAEQRSIVREEKETMRLLDREKKRKRRRGY